MKVEKKNFIVLSYARENDANFMKKYIIDQIDLVLDLDQLWSPDMLMEWINGLLGQDLGCWYWVLTTDTKL